MILGNECLLCRGTGWGSAIAGTKPELCASCKGNGGRNLAAAHQLQIANLNQRLIRVESVLATILTAAKESADPGAQS